MLRRYAALAAAVSRAMAAGGRIAEPQALQRHARAVLDGLGIGLEAAGPLRVPGTVTGTLVVANHTSWLDVVALLAVEPVPLIAKREVAAWPVVGGLARRTGTWFIDREALRELPCVVRDLAARLRDGETVAVFPQATTWCTAPGGPFRRATFQAALDAGAPVRPVAVDFTREGRSSTAAAYVGDDTFASSLRRVAATDALGARVRVCAPLWPYGHDRRSLAAAAHGAVSASCAGSTGSRAHESFRAREPGMLGSR
ncbi:lysophospholipid acyltransferase family protein [Streptomyces abyssalis]|uniref:lysophospholipid acyltransferase family protein n=1 Tax=Streptomyces abyssalis TaxID=933944 RepID=UPI00085CAEFA|nr:lysophospholipid acyltransferase family protein [Streptomyces abyssalis]